MKVCIIPGIIPLPAGPAFAQTEPVWRVDDQGNLTVNGQIFHIRGGSWTGLEGRDEPSDDPSDPNSAPMEMYMGNCWWAPSGRTYELDVQEFASIGINTVRIPLVTQTLDPENPQGREDYPNWDDEVSCGGYNVTQWLGDLRELAGLGGKPLRSRPRSAVRAKGQAGVLSACLWPVSVRAEAVHGSVPAGV